MDYQLIYDNIIKTAKSLKRKKHQGVYYEEHHILPRCMGGGEELENRVLLTAREHFMCHKILCKLHPGHYGLLQGFGCMHRHKTAKKYLTARQYEESLRAHREANKATKDRESGYHYNDGVGKLTQQQKQEIYDVFTGSTIEKELIGKLYGIGGKIVIRVLQEFGLTGKQIKTIACKKREYRHKIQLLQNGLKRDCHNAGVPRPKKAIESQREKIKQYWQDVRDGKRIRKDKMVGWKPIRCIETGRTWPSQHSASKEFYVQKISKQLVSRTNPKEIYHWEYISKPNGI